LLDDIGECGGCGCANEVVANIIISTPLYIVFIAIAAAARPAAVKDIDIIRDVYILPLASRRRRRRRRRRI